MIRIVVLTEAGKRLAVRLQSLLEGAQVCYRVEVSYKPQPFAQQVQQFFSQADRLIFICATGIVMRSLAPVIKNKLQDPPVLVLDELGQFVIPLLSGHEGGANDWAAQVAELLGAQAVITTAKPYLRPLYTVGMGCERGCPVEELEGLLTRCLEQTGLSLEQIESISSIDIKADEVGLMALAEKLGKPFLTWNKQQLNTMDHLLSTRSDYIYKTVGVYGVAESAALYAAQQATGEDAELLLNKHKTPKATCAIARSYPALSGTGESNSEQGQYKMQQRLQERE